MARKTSKTAAKRPVRKTARPKAAPEKPVPKLTARQLAFASEYAKHGVAYQAAIAAGYAKTTALAQGKRLLEIVGVQEEVTRIVSSSLKKAEVTVERIVDEMATLAFSDLTDFAEWDQGDKLRGGVRLKDSASLDPKKRRAVIEVSEGQHGLKIKLASKQAALDSLAKYRGMFIERHELTVTNLADMLKARRERARKASGRGR